jgi:hypothetical protein
VKIPPKLTDVGQALVANFASSTRVITGSSRSFRSVDELLRVRP